MKNMTTFIETTKATVWHNMPGRGYAIDSINSQPESQFIRVLEGEKIPRV